MTPKTKTRSSRRSEIGGAFHFVYQTADAESPQSPAIYIFSAANRESKTIYSWSYKVAYVQGGLYIERHIPPDQGVNGLPGRVEKEAFFDPASRPDMLTVDRVALEESVRKEVDSLPFYFFCGFGFTPPEDRKSFGFQVSSKGKKEDISDRDGRLVPQFQKQIITNFESGVRV